MNLGPLRIMTEVEELIPRFDVVALKVSVHLLNGQALDLAQWCHGIPFGAKRKL